MIEVIIKDEYIKLQQALQIAGTCSSGAEAKYEIIEGRVRVNGEEELRRGRKMRNGDTFSHSGKDYKIVVK